MGISCGQIVFFLFFFFVAPRLSFLANISPFVCISYFACVPGRVCVNAWVDLNGVCSLTLSLKGFKCSPRQIRYLPHLTAGHFYRPCAYIQFSQKVCALPVIRANNCARNPPPKRAQTRLTAEEEASFGYDSRGYPHISVETGMRRAV